MSRRTKGWLGLCLVLIASNATGSNAMGVEVPDFNRQVLPIFRKYCNGCHNAKEAEGGLVLEDFARTTKGGESGPEIVPGKSAESRLWKLVTSRDDDRMPPKDQRAPNADELAILKAWIDSGAKPREPTDYIYMRTEIHCVY